MTDLYVCGMTHLYMCDMTRLHVRCWMHSCNACRIRHYRFTHLCVWQDSFTCVRQDSFICVWHNSFICVWHDSFTRVWHYSFIFVWYNTSKCEALNAHLQRVPNEVQQRYTFHIQGEQMYTFCIHISMSMHTLYTYRACTSVALYTWQCVAVRMCTICIQGQTDVHSKYRVCTSVASVAPYIQKAHILYTEVRMLYIGSYI